MSNFRSEFPISASIPVGGRAILADLAHRAQWSDATLQYYLGDASTLNFSQDFRDSYNSRYDSDTNPDQNFAFQVPTIESFEAIDAVIATDFVRIRNRAEAQAEADLIMVSSPHNIRSGLEGFFLLPGAALRGLNDFWSIGVLTSDSRWLTIGPEVGGGEYVRWTLLHEIGHGLGLLHSFDRSGVVLPSIGDALDNARYTVMSYDAATLDDAFFGHAVTMMALDIAALQAQYGAETYATGNSAYSLRDARDVALVLDENNWHIGRAYASIWDSGGTDAIRYMSSENAALINLNDATLERSNVASDVAPSLAALALTQRFASLSEEIRTETTDPDYHAGGFFSRVLTAKGQALDGGYSIAHGAQIENAVGGIGDDILVGNELDNRLTGSGGDDVLIGGYGDDTLQGGPGRDTAGFSDISTAYSITPTGGGDYVVFHEAEGIDSLTGVELAQFTDKLLDLTLLTGTLGVNRAGTDHSNTLAGSAGVDTLSGLAGNDTLSGLGADDRLDGGSGDDLLYGENAGPRLALGDGLSDFARTIAVPNAIRQGYSAVRMDAGFSLKHDSDIDQSTLIPHLTASYATTDVDYIYLAFDIVAGEQLIIDIDGAQDLSGGFDSIVRLYDAAGTLLVTNDDSNPISDGGLGSASTYDSYLDITPSQTGTYFAEVGRYHNSPIPENERFEINVSQDFSTPRGTHGYTGSAGNDVLFGRMGHDTLYGGDGADTLNGGDGDDFIYGGDTEEDLHDVVRGGLGHDWIDGGYGNDQLRGDAGSDTMFGGYGADILLGGDGDDFLTGSAWGDRLLGGNGDDFLHGGAGSDRLNGGAGADQFFHLGVPGHGSDWIRDYVAAQGDLLHSGLAQSSASDYRVSFANTPGAGDASLDEAFVRYGPTGEVLWVLIDGESQDKINLQIGLGMFDLLAA